MQREMQREIMMQKNLNKRKDEEINRLQRAHNENQIKITCREEDPEEVIRRQRETIRGLELENEYLRESEENGMKNEEDMAEEIQDLHSQLEGKERVEEQNKLLIDVNQKQVQNIEKLERDKERMLIEYRIDINYQIDEREKDKGKERGRSVIRKSSMMRQGSTNRRNESTSPERGNRQRNISQNKRQNRNNVNEEETKKLEEIRKNITCWEIKNGYCRFGRHCIYGHPEELVKIMNEKEKRKEEEEKSKLKYEGNIGESWERQDEKRETIVGRGRGRAMYRGRPLFNVEGSGIGRGRVGINNEEGNEFGIGRKEVEQEKKEEEKEVERNRELSPGMKRAVRLEFEKLMKEKGEKN